MTNSSSGASRATVPPVWRHFISGVIAFHFALLWMAMAGNISSSPLQNALRTGFRPYVQFLHLDPDLKPLHFTHADVADTAHLIEWNDDAAGQGEWQPLARPARGTLARQRMLNLGQVLAAYVESENQTEAAEIAKTLAEYVHHQGVPVRRIRLRRQLLQDSLELRQAAPARSPGDPAFFRTLFEANVIITEQGEALINKVDATMETAAPVDDEETVE